MREREREREREKYKKKLKDIEKTWVLFQILENEENIEPIIWHTYIEKSYSFTSIVYNMLEIIACSNIAFLLYLAILKLHLLIER